jgi:hypothetical protein
MRLQIPNSDSGLRSDCSQQRSHVPGIIAVSLPSSGQDSQLQDERRRQARSLKLQAPGGL